MRANYYFIVFPPIKSVYIDDSPDIMCYFLDGLRDAILLNVKPLLRPITKAFIFQILKALDFSTWQGSC